MKTICIERLNVERDGNASPLLTLSSGSPSLAKLNHYLIVPHGLSYEEKKERLRTMELPPIKSTSPVWVSTGIAEAEPDVAGLR